MSDEQTAVVTESPATASDTASDTGGTGESVSEYEAIKAAVDAATEADAVEGEKKPVVPKMGDKPANDAEEAANDTTLPKIAAIFRAREKARETFDKSKHEAEQLLTNARRQAEEDGARIRKEATDQAKREVQEMLTRLKTRPLEAIRDIGWDRDQLVNEVAKEGSPEYQLMKKLEARADAAEKKLQEYDSRWELAVKEREETRVKAAQDSTRQIEKQFLNAITLDTAPALRKLYDDSEIIQKGHAIARRLRDETGDDASLEDIRDYLEHEAKKRLDGLRQQDVGEQKSDANKKKANGQRTLSATSTSERRATPKSLRDMSPEEEKKALLEAVDSAMKGSAA